MENNIIPNQSEDKDETEMEHNHVSEDLNSRVVESHEINDAERDIIKGDTVGQTLYSAKWILNTLISLSNVYEGGWTESMETDLCTLWDMTLEKDIVEFLLENDFLKMAEFTLKTSKEPRLTEIIVGIIGNMCCEAKSLEKLGTADELVSLILSLVSSDDVELLIQVLRILHAIMWDIQKNNAESLWLKKIREFEVLGEEITFILKSSTSDELLTPALDFVYLISEIELPGNDKFIEDIFDVDRLIFALCQAMTELISQDANPHAELQLKNIENWFNVMRNIIKKGLLEFSNTEGDENFAQITTVILKILLPYESISNLMSSEEKSLLCIQQCVRMVVDFQYVEMLPSAQLIKSILAVMVSLKAAAAESKFEDSDDFKQLHDYSAYYWLKTLKTIDQQQITRILKLCNPRTIEGIVEITKSLPGVSEHSVTKLSQARSLVLSV